MKTKSSVIIAYLDQYVIIPSRRYQVSWYSSAISSSSNALGVALMLTPPHQGQYILKSPIITCQSIQQNDRSIISLALPPTRVQGSRLMVSVTSPSLGLLQMLQIQTLRHSLPSLYTMRSVARSREYSYTSQYYELIFLLIQNATLGFLTYRIQAVYRSRIELKVTQLSFIIRLIQGSQITIISYRSISSYRRNTAVTVLYLATLYYIILKSFRLVSYIIVLLSLLVLYFSSLVRLP